MDLKMERKNNRQREREHRRMVLTAAQFPELGEAERVGIFSEHGVL